MLSTREKAFKVVLFWASFAPLNAEFQVATHKPASQSTTLSPYVADRAVDGDKGDKYMRGCSFTQSGQTSAWWRVDLENLYFIQRVVIYPRPHNDSSLQTAGRFAGFSVAVSESRDTGYNVCFEYGKNSPLPNVLIPHIAHCNPKVRGRFVMILNNRDDPPYGAGYSTEAYINLCEVEVYVEDCMDTCTDCVCSACANGFYGERCNETCSEYCGGDGSCYQTDGKCNSQSCIPGYYGEQCNIACSWNCIGGSCEFHNGYCERCNGNYFGTNCSKKCPSNCRSCTSESFCTECEDKWYGRTCEKDCSNCGSSKCEKDTGICIGDYCKNGYFTINCNKTCSENCAGDRLCNFSSGACNDCIDGSFGANCELHCLPRCRICTNTSYCIKCYHGLYGNVCDKYCLQCGGDGNCDITGNCEHGCKSSFYGSHCELKCPANCGGNRECTIAEGSCINGCNVGWKGDFCQLECSNSTFGEGCSKTCGKCKNNLCHNVYGTCLQGCRDGWTSLQCDIEEYDNTATIVGAAIGGSIGGILFVLLGVFIILFILRSRHCKEKNKDKNIYMLPISHTESNVRVYESVRNQGVALTPHQGTLDIQEPRIGKTNESFDNYVNISDTVYYNTIVRD